MKNIVIPNDNWYKFLTFIPKNIRVSKHALKLVFNNSYQFLFNPKN